ncbi:hypothetical protein [Burkholderia sp. Ac-20365]|uniref:hypothetical protein n=1 Tax=Burkholderia sp. Ac-20365 TaxID=2703897 RepID=UPI00197C92CB|nr:hypothetical protein [Burkholderia sp. Ac-20365]MBN3761206.1 hypothetical protein [Burkholderia sp. Ac-20365]
MRIPLLHADFEHGSITRIAKALRKSWPLGEQSLMQSQNLLTVLFGYNNLHDAQREATASFPFPEGSVSMQQLASSVAWRMFVRHGIDLLRAQEIVAGIHLHELAVDSICFEVKMRRIAEAAASKGMIYDEGWALTNSREPWPDLTPDLLRSGIPPYKWAIYPDRRAFVWSLLVRQIEMLPADYADHLREARGLGEGQDAVNAFLVESLVPAACRPLATVLADAQLSAAIMGQQWDVKWIVTPRTGEILGSCIMAAKLGAMVARVFAPDGADAYEAMADLLCGGSVNEELAGAEEDTLVMEPFCLLDRDRVDKLRAGRQDMLKDVWYHEQWPENVMLHRDHRGYRLSGRVFREQDTAYIATAPFDVREQQRMLREEPVFETIQVGGDELELAEADIGIPASGNHWHDVVDRLFTTRQADVERVMRTPAGVSQLMHAVTANISVNELEAWMTRTLEEDLPLRRENETEEDGELIRERGYAMNIAEQLGRDVLASMPGLTGYPVLALGLLTLAAGDEYPGSRGQSMIDAPAATDWTTQSLLLASMLVYDRPAHRMRLWPLRCAIAPVLGVVALPWSREKVGNWYQSACSVAVQLKNARDQLERVAQWRQIEQDAVSQRKQGEFLRVGDAIPATKPKSLMEAFGETFFRSRSKGFRSISVTQDPSQLAARGG